MTIFINQSEYISTAQRAGIKVIAQEANNPIFGDNMGAELPAGYMASISLQQVNQERDIRKELATLYHGRLCYKSRLVVQAPMML